MIVWRPQFGTTDDFLAGVNYPTEEHPVGGFGGPKDLREFSDCGLESNYGDREAAYTVTQSPEVGSESEPLEETPEEPAPQENGPVESDSAASQLAVNETDWPDPEPSGGDGLLYGII